MQPLISCLNILVRIPWLFAVCMKLRFPFTVNLIGALWYRLWWTSLFFRSQTLQRQKLNEICITFGNVLKSSVVPSLTIAAVRTSDLCFCSALRVRWSCLVWGRFSNGWSLCGINYSCHRIDLLWWGVSDNCSSIRLRKQACLLPLCPSRWAFVSWYGKNVWSSKSASGYLYLTIWICVLWLITYLILG